MSLPCGDINYCVTHIHHRSSLSLFFFFTAPATTEIYTLSLHDALPISFSSRLYLPSTEAFSRSPFGGFLFAGFSFSVTAGRGDRKSTRLNSSHVSISYAVFCLKKKKN